MLVLITAIHSTHRAVEIIGEEFAGAMREFHGEA